MLECYITLSCLAFLIVVMVWAAWLLCHNISCMHQALSRALSCMLGWAPACAAVV